MTLGNAMAHVASSSLRCASSSLKKTMPCLWFGVRRALCGVVLVVGQQPLHKSAPVPEEHRALRRRRRWVWASQVSGFGSNVEGTMGFTLRIGKRRQPHARLCDHLPHDVARPVDDAAPELPRLPPPAGQKAEKKSESGV